MTQNNLQLPSKSSFRSSIPAFRLHRVLESAEANFALQLQNFDERTALCLIIHLAKKDPMADVSKIRTGHHDGQLRILLKHFETIIPCENHQVCDPSPAFWMSSD